MISINGFQTQGFGGKSFSREGIGVEQANDTKIL